MIYIYIFIFNKNGVLIFYTIICHAGVDHLGLTEFYIKSMQ